MKVVWILILPVFMVLGCQYNPEGDNFHDLTIPDPSMIDITDLSGDDTLFLEDNTPFELSVINAGGRRVYDVKVLIDGEQLYSTYGYPWVQFSIYPASYSTGVHEVEAIFYLSSGSGSLADRLGSEIIEVSKKWKIEVDNGPPTKLSITSIQRENGALTITWTPYERKNFSRYRLYLGCCRYFETANIFTTSYVDDTFVGGSKDYIIAAYDVQERNTTSDIKTFTDDGLALRSVQQLGNSFQVSWSRTKYYNSFQSYMVTEESGSWPYFSILKSTNSIDDTTVTLSPAGVPFGSSKSVNITTVSKAFKLSEPNDFRLYPTETVAIYQGVKKQSHWVYTYAMGNNSVYSLASGKLFRLDAETLDTLASTVISSGLFLASDNGEHAYNVVGSTISKLNPATLAVEENISVSTLFGQTVWMSNGSVSNNNFMLAGAQGSIWVVDMNARQIVFSGSGHTDDMKLSADGQMLFDGTKILGYNGSQYVELMDLTNFEYRRVFFNPTKPTEAIVLVPFERKVTIVKPLSGTIAREFFLPDNTTSIRVDSKSGLALLNGGNYNAVYDLENEKIVFDFGYSGSAPFYLFNNKLYRAGYFISLADYQE